MKIRLNGNSKDITQSAKLSDIVGSFCPNSQYIIAELNGTIIKNEKWTEYSLEEGDAVELVSFVGGG